MPDPTQKKSLIEKFYEKNNMTLFDTFGQSNQTNLDPVTGLPRTKEQTAQWNMNLLKEAEEDAKALEIIDQNNKQAEIYADLDLETQNKVGAYAQKSGADHQSVLAFKANQIRLQELNGKATMKKKYADAQKEYEKSSGWGSILPGLKNMAAGVGSYIDDLFTKDKESLEGKDSWYEPDEFQYSNLEGLTEAETLEYYNLIEDQNEFQRPIAQQERKRLKDLITIDENNSQSIDFFDMSNTGLGGKTIPNEMIKPEWLDENGRVDTSLIPEEEGQALSRDLKVMNLTDRYLKKEISKLDDFVDGDTGFWSGFGEHKEGLLTFGIIPMFEQFSMARLVSKSRDEGEQLTEAEQQYLKIIGEVQDVQKNQFNKDNFLYNTGTGLGYSAIFMEQMLLTSGSSAVVNPLTTKIGMRLAMSQLGLQGTKLSAAQMAKIGAIKVLDGVGKVGVQSLISPGTVTMASEKYVGAIQNIDIKDKDGNLKEYTLVDRGGRIKAINDAATRTAAIDLKLKQLEDNITTSTTNVETGYTQVSNLMSDDQKAEEIKALKAEKEYIKNAIATLYTGEGKTEDDIIKEIGATEAYVYGFLETAKEYAAEKFVGAGLQKGIGAVGKGIKGSKYYNSVQKNKYIAPLGNAKKYIDDQFNKGKDFINDKYIDGTKMGTISKNAMYHTGQAQIWHGVPSEFLEEIAVQLTPSYVDNWKEEWEKQIEELANPEFYAQVALSTLIMGGTFTTFNKGAEAKKYLFDKEYRKEVKKNRGLLKQSKKTYAELDKSVTDDELANRILMSTGGTIFDMQDYQREIDKLKMEGKVSEANKIEEMSFMNLAAKALKTNTIDRFARSIQRIATNTKLSQETRNNAVNALNYIPTLKKIKEDSSKYYGSDELMTAEMNNVFFDKSMETADQKFKELEKAARTKVEKYKRRNSSDTDMTLDNFRDKVDDPEFTEFVKALDKEGITEAKDLMDLFMVQETIENVNYENYFRIKDIKSVGYQMEAKAAHKKAVADKAKRNANSKNVTKKKQELVDQELAEPENIAAVNEVAVNSGTNRKAPTTIAKEEISQTFQTINEDELFGDEDDTLTTVSADDLFDDDTQPESQVSGKKSTIIDEDQSLFAPMPFNSKKESHNKVLNNMAGIFENLNDQGLLIDFPSIMATMKDHFSAVKVEQNYDIIAKAYEKVAGVPVKSKDYSETYSQLFPLAQANIIGNELNVTPIEVAETEKTPPRKEYNPVTEINEDLDRTGDKRYADIGIKLGGVLGRNYEGQPGERLETITNEINEDSKPFIDHRNFRPGSEVEFVFDIDYLLEPNNPITRWIDVDSNTPEKDVVTVKEFLTEMFEGQFTYDEVVAKLDSYRITGETNELFDNVEFLRQIPIGVNNKGYASNGKDILPGGLNSYYWFNPAMVALKYNNETGNPAYDERAQRIEANRRINMNARKSILANGVFKATVSSNTNKDSNTRILETEKEKEQNYPDQFYSILSQFGNSLEEFNKNAAVGYIDGNFTLIGGRDNKNRPSLVTVDGKEITKDNIDKKNWENFIKSIRESGMTSGTTFFLHKSGIDVDGNDVYSIHRVLNNHQSKQEEFKRVNDTLDGLRKKLLFLNEKETARANITEADKQQAEKIKKAFYNKFGIRLTRQTFKRFQKIYPSYLSSDSSVYRQDFSHSDFDLVPDLADFTDYTQFENALLSEQNISTVNRMEIMLGNFHTNLVFTPIENNGETIYTTDSQPFMMFDSEIQNDSIDRSREQVLSENTVRLEKKRESIEKEIASSNNEVEKEQLEKQLEKTKKEIKKTVSEINNVKVIVDDIEVIDEEQIDDVNTYQNEIDFLENENNRNEILGITDYNDSAREYIDLELDLTEEDLATKTLLYERMKEEYNLLIEELKGKSYQGSNTNFSKYEIISEVVSRTLYKTFLVGKDLKFNEKGYEKSSFEIDITKSLSFQTKMMLAGIKDSRRKNNSFADLKENLSINDTLEALHQVLSKVENNTIEEVERVINARVERNPDQLQFFNDMLKRLKEINETNPEIIKELLYNLYQPELKMNFVMWKVNSDGNFVLDNFDANSKNPQFIKRNSWLQGLKSNGLLDLYEGRFYEINEKEYENLQKTYDTLQKQYTSNDPVGNVKDVDVDVLKKYLSYFGIKLNNKTYDNMYQGVKSDTNNVTEMLFRDKNGIIQQLKKNIDKAKAGTKKLTLTSVTDFKTEARLNPLEQDNSQINDLIKIDNFVEFIPMNTMYIAGKTIYMYQQPNSILNKVKALRTSDGETMKELLSSPITSNSMLLNLIKSDPEVAEYFDTFTMSLEAIKETGTKSKSNMGITELSDKDSFMTLFGMFLSSEGKIENLELENEGISLRKGVISFPTISDASQLPMLKTALIELSTDNYDANTDVLSGNILDILTEQFLVSDLKRIGDYMTKVPGSSNIKHYDDGAVWITSMPSLNLTTLETKDATLDDGTMVKRSLIDLFRSEMETIRDDKRLTSEQKETKVQETIYAFTNKHREAIHSEISLNMSHEADKFISKDGSTGQFNEFELIDVNGNFKIGNNQSEAYFKDKSARHIAMDYVVNYMLQQKEIQTIFAGDIAGYFKTNMSSNLKHHLPRISEKDIMEYGDESLLQYADTNVTPEIDHNEIYEALLPVARMKVFNMFKDVQNNVSKRLKELVSPGNQLPNSKDTKPYYQLMMDDVENASRTLQYLTEVNYPELAKDKDFMNDLVEFKKLDEIYNKDDVQTARHEKLFNQIKDQIPTIAAYLKTASTDGQEYVTWQDNLNQLVDQGRMSNVDYESLTAKLEQQQKDLANQGYISEENRLTDTEKKISMMQPSKPLYSGLHIDDVNGHKASRYVYIKSSSFPLTPELVEKFPDLYIMSKNMARLGKETGGIVRASYQSANKTGAVANAITVGDLYDENIPLSQLQASSVKLDRKNFYIQQDKPFKGDKNTANGKLDQVTRATQFEKIILGDGISKMGHVFPASNFDASILESLDIEVKEGNINGPALKKIYNEIYRREQSLLTQKLFKELGITDFSEINEGKPSVMENLAKVLNKRLSNKQDKQALELQYVDSNNYVYTKKELNDAEDVEIVKAEFTVPLFMTPNSRKFESVMNSIINNNNINLKLPGYSSPIASEEGFRYRGFGEVVGEETSEEALTRDLEDLKKKGLVTTPGFDPSKGLQATRTADGKLAYAQVFAPNRFKHYNEETRKYELIELADYVNEKGQLDTERFPKELLSMFSYRIPTSAHQSGTIIEIAGFLPRNHADLMIVPKDHTVQIGEDFDIDVRFMYTYNVKKDANGNLVKLNYDNIAEAPEKTVSELYNEYQDHLETLWKDVVFGENENVLNNPQRGDYAKLSMIAFIEEGLIDTQSTEDQLATNMMSAIFGEDYREEFVSDTNNETIARLKGSLLKKANYDKKAYGDFKNLLREAWKNEKSDLKYAWKQYTRAVNDQNTKGKILENNLVAMYKSVFGSNSDEVQFLITKVLSTDFSEDSAKAIENKRKANDEFYNIYSPVLQRDVMKLGSDGKVGIGLHSNAVTFNSLLQQLDNQLQLIGYRDAETGRPKPFNIKFGKLTFDGKLGEEKDKSGRRISEYIMESQNSSTDNQKLQIMGKRNETPETMGVFSLLQMMGIENDGVTDISYASLFTAQNVLVDYVNSMKSFKSSTNKEFGDPADLTEAMLLEKYAKNIPVQYWQVDEKSGMPMVGTFKKEYRDKIGKELTSKKLFDQISDPNDTSEVDYASQWYVYQQFIRLQSPANDIRELQQFVNIENGGLGISYFNTIDLMKMVGKVNDFSITTVKDINNTETDDTSSELFKEMFGEYIEVPDTQVSDLQADGYVFINKNKDGRNIMVKPTNHYSHKIMNSVSLGYNLWNNFFPYDNDVISDQITTILDSLGIKEDTSLGLDTKYQIMSSMKDYVYSNNSSLFGTSVTDTQRELFFDIKGEDGKYSNMSLGSYIQTQLEGNLEFEYIMKQPFFKDLKIEVNSADYPTTISLETGDVSPQYNARMNNLLASMIDSTEELPLYNGKRMTKGDLAKKILAYSMIADQANGATGFRKVIPMQLLQKYKVDDLLRKRNNSSQPVVMSMVYNGVAKSVESLLGAETNYEGVIENNKGLSQAQLSEIIKRTNATLGEPVFKIVGSDIVNTSQKDGSFNTSTFVRQFVQHNADKVKNKIYYNQKPSSEFVNLLKENMMTVSDFEKGALKGFASTNYASKYIVIKDKQNNDQLFERYSRASISMDKTLTNYRRIPVLGVNGFNEYNVGKQVTESKVTKNNFIKGVPSTPITNPTITVADINQASLDALLNGMMNNKNNQYSGLLEMIKQFIPNLGNVEIKTASTLRGKAEYRGNVIYINEEYINQPGVTIQDVESAIMEETLHHATVSTVNEYGSFVLDGGEVLFQPNEGVQTPSEIMTMTMVYQDAMDHYMEKYGKEKLLAKIEQYGSDVAGDASIIANEQFDYDAYRLTNFHEFIAGLFIKDSEFANEMANTTYKKSKDSILSKINKLFLTLMDRVLGNTKKDSIAANGLAEFYNFLKNHHAANPVLSQKPSKSPLDKPESNAVKEAQSLLESEPEIELTPEEILQVEIDRQKTLYSEEQFKIDNPDTTNSYEDEIQKRAEFAIDLGNTLDTDDLFSPMNTFDNVKEKYFGNKDRVTSIQVLDIISASKHPLNRVAEMLKPYVENINNPVIQLGGLGGFAGMYYSDSNTIVIDTNVKFKGLGSEPTMIHEIIHALTYNALRTNTTNKKEFDAIYKEVKSQIGDTYATKNTDEFMVALFTDAAFIKKLAETPSSRNNDSKLHDVFEYILSLFNINTDSNMYKTAFDAATTILNDTVEQNKVNEMYKELDDLPELQCN